jgi:2-polyprenyl-3-methyl-5-hydroxy-6-metoxy-1,4-benzoquinol methylase
MSPLSNAYLSREDLGKMERFYPLHALVCDRCFLVQLEQFESPENIFSSYAYFSSYSDSWLDHVRHYVDKTTKRFALTAESLVVEIASNDGYLLQYFQAKGVPVLGIEPAQNIADVARGKGIRTLTEFFGARVARELSATGQSADLIVANNVLAHVPDLNDFVDGLKLLLKPRGIITVEFPHLLRLIEGHQFDTIYHEHFSYFSLLTLEEVFRKHGLTVFDVDELSTHGGSLRLYIRHASDNEEDTDEPSQERLAEVRDLESAAGMRSLKTYLDFEEKVRKTKRGLLEFLLDAKRRGKSVAAYGAPAKGNTLLNYCGIGKDFIDYTVDISPHKQGLFLPGTHIPIFHPDELRRTKPDYVLLLPWNLRQEILEQLADVRRAGSRFVLPVPNVEVIE